MNTPLEGTIQHITIGSLTVYRLSLFYCFLFNTTLSALSHRPQLTSDTIPHYNLTFYCACPFGRCLLHRRLQLEHLQKITRGSLYHSSNLSLTVELSFTPLPLSPRSPVRGCATRLSFPLLFLYLPSCSFFTLSDCLVIFYIYFQLERLFIFLCFFFSIFIYLLYIWIEIYMYIFLKTNIYHIFFFFLLREPWCYVLR